MKKKRAFPWSYVNMMTASRVIAGSFRDNIPRLEILNNKWNPAYADNLILRIEDGFEKYLGMDPQREQVQATTNLNKLKEEAMGDLKMTRRMIKVYNKTRARRLLKDLGFNSYYRSATRGDQEAFINLLYAFKDRMNDKLKGELMDSGIPSALIDRITSYPKEFMHANVTQEQAKEASAELTDEAVDFFNDIYREVIGICKIASLFYKDDPVKKDQFTFSKVVRNLNFHRAIRDEDKEASSSDA
jgi:hypothetical protein